MSALRFRRAGITASLKALAARPPESAWARAPGRISTTLPAGGATVTVGADSTSSEAPSPISDEAVDAELDRYVSEIGLDALPVTAKMQATRRDRN